MIDTKIEWTDRTWNPIRGCSRVSEGCSNCYAERMAARFSRPGGDAIGGGTYPALPYHGYAEMTNGGPRWTGKVSLVEDHINDPLKWFKPSRIFVNSMSDLFHESLPDEAIDRVFAVMALAPQHTFQILTKRPERMHAYLTSRASGNRILAVADGYFDDDETAIFDRLCTVIGEQGCLNWPLPNVWIGVSVENQETADKRIQLLMRTPAAVRCISAEPLLGPLDIFYWTHYIRNLGPHYRGLDWVVVGGESGPGARPCNIEWIRSAVEQCKDAAVPVFVKQLGKLPTMDNVNLHDWPHHVKFVGCGVGAGAGRAVLRHPKGSDMSEWPEDLKVREFPQEFSAAGIKIAEIEGKSGS